MPRYRHQEFLLRFLKQVAKTDALLDEAALADVTVAGTYDSVARRDAEQAPEPERFRRLLDRIPRGQFRHLTRRHPPLPSLPLSSIG